MTQFVQLDLSSEETQVCVVSEDGTIVPEAKLDSTSETIAAALAEAGLV